MRKVWTVLTCLLVTAVAACKCPPCPCADMAHPPDLAVPADLSHAPPDLSHPADMACVGQFGSCVAPAVCCRGLDCVGGLCARVGLD